MTRTGVSTETSATTYKIRVDVFCQFHRFTGGGDLVYLTWGDETGGKVCKGAMRDLVKVVWIV